MIIDVGGRVRDQLSSDSAAVLFTTSLAISFVAIPLLAVGEGYSTTTVGLLAASAALFQICSRAILPALLRRCSARTIVILGLLAMVVSCLVVLPAATLPALVVNQAVQGVGRALYWTGSQTHAVRTSRSSLRGLARLNTAAGSGMLVGPLLAGSLIAVDARLPLVAAAFVAAVALVPAVLLLRMPPPVPADDAIAPHPLGATGQEPTGVISNVGAGVRSLRLPQVQSAVSTGVWLAIMNSYGALLFATPGRPVELVGAILAGANALFLFGGWLVGRIPTTWTARVFAIGHLMMAGGLVVAGLVREPWIVPAAAYTLSALGAGALLTLGLAVAADSAASSKQGTALATVGVWRAVAMLATPAGLGASMVVLSLPVSIVVCGAVVALPAARRRPPRTPGN